MKATLTFFCLLMALASVKAEANDDASIKQAFRASLVEFIYKLDQGPTFSKLAGNLSKDTIASQIKYTETHSGWRYSWTISQGTEMVPTPYSNMSVGLVPKIQSDLGILFTAFISFGNGEAGVPRHEQQILIENPKVVAGFFAFDKYQSDGWFKDSNFYFKNRDKDPLSKEVRSLFQEQTKVLGSQFAALLENSGH